MDSDTNFNKKDEIYNNPEYYDINQETSDLDSYNFEQQRHFLSDNDLRSLTVPMGSDTINPDIYETPYDIRESAVFEAVKNRKSAISNLKNGNIGHFELKYKKKRDLSFTLGGFKNVKRISNNEFCVYKTLMPKDEKNILTAEKLHEGKYRECSIHFDGLYYYLLIPENREKKYVSPNGLTCSIDPGVRTFATLYCPDKEMCMKLGENLCERMFSIQEQIFQLKSKLDKGGLTKKKRKFIKKIIFNKYRKIKNLQTEMHNKISYFLCNNFKQVVIPEFGSKNMISRDRNLHPEVKRKMMLLGHCKFLQRLKTKAEEFGTLITIVDERYTTMTCSRCCARNNVGKKEEWECLYRYKILPIYW